MKRAEIQPGAEGCLGWFGIAPYAVKPSGTVVAEAIGASNDIQSGDWEFACKAGTEAMVAAIAMVRSGMGDYALAIGMDTAQGSPATRWNLPPRVAARLYHRTAAPALVNIEASYSFVSIRDFWRRNTRSTPNMGSVSQVNRHILSMLAIRQHDHG